MKTEYDFNNLYDLKRYLESDALDVNFIFKGQEGCFCIIGEYGKEIFGKHNFEASLEYAQVITFDEVQQKEIPGEIIFCSWQEYISRRACADRSFNKAHALEIVETAIKAVELMTLKIDDLGQLSGIDLWQALEIVTGEPRNEHLGELYSEGY